MSPVFVCFYTANYRDHAMNLRRSLDRFKLRHDLHFVTSKGLWQRNCQRKAPFLRTMLHRHSGPIVWIDADARMRQEPTLLQTLAYHREADVGVHTYGLSGGRQEVLSGTIYLDDTPAAHDLLDAWQDRCVAKPAEFDQRSLQHVLEENAKADAFDGTSTPLRVAALPAEYCFIHDQFRSPMYRRNHPDVGEPVIEHMQHSRVVRAKEKP